MQNTFNDITFTVYNSNKFILHTNEGKHYLINADKKIEIEKILQSNDDTLKRDVIEKIKTLKSTIKNKNLFFSDFQFRKAIVSEANMQSVVKPFEFLFNKYIFSSFAIIIIFALPIIYFKGVFFQNVQTINVGYSWLVFFGAFIFHEIGHSTACVKYNGKPGEIGFGILSYLPVLYADVTDAWRLEKRQRMIVNFGGIYFQNLISIILLIFSVIFDQVGIYIIAKTIFIATGYQFFPFYKSDGYWILSDLISEPNLFRNARKSFYKKLKNPSNKIGTRNSLIMIYYIMMSTIIISFIVKMWFHYYKYIITMPSYFYKLILEIIHLNLNELKFDIQYLWALIYLFFITRMIINNIKEFILSKGADKIKN